MSRSSPCFLKDLMIFCRFPPVRGGCWSQLWPSPVQSEGILLCDVLVADGWSFAIARQPKKGSTWENRTSRVVQLISVEGSALKRARQHWHAAGQQPNAEAMLLVWLDMMGGCLGTKSCHKNFREDGRLSCPYAGFAGVGPAVLLFFLLQANALLNRTICCGSPGVNDAGA